jgi:hypothetical protein
MSAKAIREATGKSILNKYLKDVAAVSLLASVDESTSYEQLAQQNPWLNQVVSDALQVDRSTTTNRVLLLYLNSFDTAAGRQTGSADQASWQTWISVG